MYLRFGILKSIFSTQNWYFAFFNSKIKGPAGGGGNVPAYSRERLGVYTILLGLISHAF